MKQPGYSGEKALCPVAPSEALPHQKSCGALKNACPAGGVSSPTEVLLICEDDHLLVIGTAPMRFARISTTSSTRTSSLRAAPYPAGSVDQRSISGGQQLPTAMIRSASRMAETSGCNHNSRSAPAMAFLSPARCRAIQKYIVKCSFSSSVSLIICSQRLRGCLWSGRRKGRRESSGNIASQRLPGTRPVSLDDIHHIVDDPVFQPQNHRFRRRIPYR